MRLIIDQNAQFICSIDLFSSIGLSVAQDVGDYFREQMIKRIRRRLHKQLLRKRLRNLNLIHTIKLLVLLGKGYASI